MEKPTASIALEIRKQAWEELQRRVDKNWTDDQQLCFLAGMTTMWRLCRIENSPLFTYGPDSLPIELKEECSGPCRNRGDSLDFFCNKCFAQIPPVTRVSPEQP
jgi:hypothetical protein